HEGGAHRELRHVASIDLAQPPLVLLLARPGLDLFFREVFQGHDARCGLTRANSLSALGRPMPEITPTRNPHPGRAPWPAIGSPRHNRAQTSRRIRPARPVNGAP